jgi:ABC-type lipoprotein release transport system permease subunit
LKGLIGWAFVVAGLVLAGVGAYAATRLGAHSVWYLEHFFGPSESDGSRYRELYSFARDTLIDRMSQVRILLILLGTLLASVGGAIVAFWGRAKVRPLDQ